MTPSVFTHIECTDAVGSLSIAPGFIAYDLNISFCSDGIEKPR